MKAFINSILFLLVILISSCSRQLAPGIVYSNISYKGAIVKNIKVRWNGYYILGASKIEFCGINSQGHNIDNYSDFFGPIHVEWENEKGQKLAQNLVLTKDQLPSIKSSKPYLSSVYLYFTQDKVYLYTSDTSDLQTIKDNLYKKAGLTCQEYRDQKYIKKWGKDW